MASSVRFLQCAGFRFDSPFWDGPEKWAVIRNQDLWQTFQTVLSLCQTEKIEFLFLTGDLFEQEYVRKETVERVADSLTKLQGTRIFITPGRRDPHIITSAYRLTVWPSNVHIFSSGVSSVKIPSHNLTVSGAGWTAYQQEKSFLDAFQPINDDSIQVMLLHAAVESKRNPEGFFPIHLGQIASSNLNYLALGHREVWSGIQKAGVTTWADCGAIEARSFKDQGPHGVILGELSRDSSEVQFKELAQRTYIEKNITLRLSHDPEEIVKELMTGTGPEERKKNLYRINLDGVIADDDRIIQSLQSLLESKFKFVEVLSLERNKDSNLETRWQPANNSEGFPTQAQLFINKLKERLAGTNGIQNAEYWGLVQKIGHTALEQGRILDDN